METETKLAPESRPGDPQFPPKRVVLLWNPAFFERSEIERLGKLLREFNVHGVTIRTIDPSFKSLTFLDLDRLDEGQVEQILSAAGARVADSERQG
jgi:hypothetical protein